MILINLLPHREVKRLQRRRAFFAGLGASAIAGLAIAGLWYSIVQQMTSAQEARNEFLRTEIARLDAQIKDIANLRAEIDALKARQQAVEDLQSDRNAPVYLLTELVKQTPEGVYLTAVRQNGQTIAINGIAQTNERVSEFLRNTLYNSAWLEKPELIEIKSTSAGSNSRDPRKLYDFQMRVTLKRAKSTPPAGAASAPAAPTASGAPQPATVAKSS